MIGTVRSLLTELKRGMETLYGERLRALYLYGSHARSDQERDSDVDVLVILDHIDSYVLKLTALASLSRLYLFSATSVSAEYSSPKKLGFLRKARFTLPKS